MIKFYIRFFALCLSINLFSSDEISWTDLNSYLKDFIQDNKVTRLWDKHLYDSWFNDVQSKLPERIKENLALHALGDYMFILSSGSVSPACYSFVRKGERIYKNIKIKSMNYKKSKFGIQINGACCKEVLFIFLFDGLGLANPQIFCKEQSLAGKICRLYAAYVVREFKKLNPVVQEQVISDSDSDVEVIRAPKRFRVA